MNLEDYRFAEEHEWARQEGELIAVGISDFAQSELGDVVFVELPEVGTETVQGEPFGTIESVKAASDLYAPVSGLVAEVNHALETQPELVNQSCYEKGWMIKIQPNDLSELAKLLTAAEYERFVSEKQ